MKIRNTFLAGCALLILLTQSGCGGAWPPHRLIEIEFTVVNDDGETVEGARIGLTSDYLRAGERKLDRFEVFSDAEGRASFRERTGADLFIGVTKDGYYPSPLGSIGRGGYRINTSTTDPIRLDLEILLREIRNPIPMVGIRATYPFPVEDEWVGFDLEVGDWVAPWGGGRTEDFSAMVTRKITGPRHFSSSLKISFPDEKSGIAGPVELIEESRFLTPRKAFETGYRSTFEINRNLTKDGYQWDTQKKPEAYVLRTRVKRDQNDNMIEAHHTVLLEDIRLIGQLADRPALGLRYWFNPNTNDRNLEFDSSQNLAKD